MQVIKIGRSKHSDFKVSSDACSNDHALLIVGKDDSYLLIDKNSSNGTRIARGSNFESVKQQSLGYSDFFYIGDVELSPALILSRVQSENSKDQSNYTTIRSQSDGSLMRVNKD